MCFCQQKSRLQERIHLKPLALLEQSEVSSPNNLHQTSFTGSVKEKRRFLCSVPLVRGAVFSVILVQRSVISADAKALLECLLQSLLWTWKVTPLPFRWNKGMPCGNLTHGCFCFLCPLFAAPPPPPQLPRQTPPVTLEPLFRSYETALSKAELLLMLF